MGENKKLRDGQIVQSAKTIVSFSARKRERQNRLKLSVVLIF